MDESVTLSDTDKEFAYAYLSGREGYHSHKETTAYTIFAVEAALFGALMTTDWYDKIAAVACYPKLWALLFVLPSWVLAHTFMRWQLKKRRMTALHIGAITTSLLSHLKEETLETQQVREKAHWAIRFLDYFVPLPSATRPGDIGLEHFPAWYRNSYVKFEKGKTEAVMGECFPTIGSILILVYSFVYIFWILR